MAADWEGDFGTEYTDRNLDIPSRGDFFQKLNAYGIKSALEVGCNIGTNLEVLRDECKCEVVGLDINEHALEIADSKGLEVYYGDASEIEMESNEFDLVFTVGVLIHLNTPEMIKAMQEMHRVSRRYVMFAEYFGHDIEVPYRGERGALIKRDYGEIYKALFPDSVLMETGFLGEDEGFDDVTYWIFYDVGDNTGEDGFEQIAWESADAGSGKEPVGAYADPSIGF